VLQTVQDFFPGRHPPLSWVAELAKQNRNSMDLSRSELLAADSSSSNGSGRVWVESVSAGMRTVEAVIRELSQNDVPMLVVAERGSGKAAAAARIHVLSSRGEEPFHVFQAREASKETVAACDGYGGTVYLQEVGDLTAAVQKELVRNLARTGARGQGGQVPRGPLLRHQRGLFAASSFASEERRYSGAARLVSFGCSA
jgi:DNA-binding NtrC family response regulator